MRRFLFLAYGLICYLIFFATFLYAIAFVENVSPHRALDGLPLMDWPNAVLVNAGLLTLFALQHSVMARQGFKRLWTRVVPQPVERSTYVLFASVALLLLCWFWQPLPALYETKSPVLRIVLLSISAVGWLMVLVSTFLVNHFELFGLKQVYEYWRGVPSHPLAFGTPSIYKWVRHPIYLGFIIAFWAAPRMTAGHLFFAVMCTLYILVAIQLEERDLISFHGEVYLHYREQVAMLVPFLTRTKAGNSKVAEKSSS